MATAAKPMVVGGGGEPAGVSVISFPKPPLDLGQRVVWLGNDKPEHGTVWWMGHLPEITNDWAAGVELDNPVGGIDGCWNGKRLFNCKPCHGILISINGLIKEDDFLGNGIEKMPTPMPYDIQSLDEIPELAAADEFLMHQVRDPNGLENGPEATAEQRSQTVLVDGEISKGDRNIEQFLSAQSVPKLCNANSFDRRVYARMFAECEVEKWYEVLNFAPDGSHDGATSNTSLNYGYGIDDKLQKKGKKKKDSLSHKEKGLPDNLDESGKKKERGGIFRFFRWLRRNKSSKPPLAACDHSSSGGPGTRRTLASVRMSDMVGRRRTKSLESVTSLSRSFHYIPVGVCSDPSTDCNEVQQKQDSKEGLYEDLESNSATPQSSPPKLKCNSLEMPTIAVHPSADRGMTRDAQPPRSVRSMCTLTTNSVSSSLSRKKRRAPLPPTMMTYGVTHSAPTSQSHWIRVLPEVPITNASASATDLTCPKSDTNTNFGELNRKIAASTGAICRHAHAGTIDSTASESTPRHKRSASLTPTSPPLSTGMKFVKGPQRIGSHIKNKRKAPPPPVLVNGGLPAPPKSADFSLGDAHQESVRQNEGSQKALDSVGADEPDDFSLKMEQSLEENSESIIIVDEKDLRDAIAIEYPEQKTPELPKKTKVGKMGYLKGPDAGLEQTNRQRDDDEDLFDCEKVTLVEVKASVEGSSTALGISMPKKLEQMNSDVLHSNTSSPLMAAKLMSKQPAEKQVERVIIPSPKLDSQMNLQALQDLVESLVSQYCGNFSSRMEGMVKGNGETELCLKPTKSLAAGRLVADRNSSVRPPHLACYENMSAVAQQGGATAVGDYDQDLASQLVEQWQDRMRGTLVSSDLSFDEKKHTMSKKLFPLCDEEQSTDPSETGNDNDDDDGSGIYEPIGNFIQQQSNESEVDFACGSKHVQGSRRSSVRTSMGSEDTEGLPCNKYDKRPSVSSSVDDIDDVPKDPFVFWRDLCARERLDYSSRSEACGGSPSVKVIRRLSVNGQQQLFKGSKEGAADVKEEVTSDSMAGKSPKLSRGKSFHGGASPRFQEYANVFTATPHRMVMVEGIDMASQYASGATVPPYWPPAPLLPYPSTLHRPFTPFPAFAVLPYGSPMFADPRFGPVPTAYTNPSYSSYMYPGAQTGKAPSRNFNKQDGVVNDGHTKSIENRRQADMGGSVMQQLPMQPKFTKNYDFQTCRSPNPGHARGKPLTKVHREVASPSNIVAEHDIDSEDETDESSGSGKRTYANVWKAGAKGGSKTYANVPPSPPPRNSSGSSSRLAVGCDWLKKSSKSVEAIVKAARDEPARQCRDSGAGQDRKQNEKNSKLHNELDTDATLDRTNDVQLASSVSRTPTSVSEPVSETDVTGIVAGPLSSCRAIAEPLNASKAPNFDSFVVIGGIRVSTPLNLWPLEYELIAPELNWLKAHMTGNPLPEDPISDDLDVDRLAVNRLLKQLEVAISSGKMEEAATRARDLAQLKIQCSVVRNRKPKGDDQASPVILNMFVEDKVSHHGPIPIRIFPYASVLELKKKIFQDFEFPVALQRWILGKKLALDENATLASFGVDSDGCPVFLYLLTPDDVQITSKDLIWENNDAMNEPSKTKKRSVPRRPKREKRVVRRKSPISANEETLHQASRSTDRSNSMLTGENNDDCDTEHLGWQCAQCTLINVPFRPGCAMCGAPRPEAYVIPNNYKMPDTEMDRMELEKLQERELKEAEELQRLKNWEQYLQLDDQDVVYNTEAFECGICYVEAAPGEGVQLRDCLHSFCCDCLRNAIAHCEDVAVKCPYRDDLYSCDSVLQEREIRALVPADVYERYLQRSMATAESQAKNSFHCKTPDCLGWCIFEDNANEFACPICGHLNCITCRAIHEQLNCRQYQDKLMILARTDEEAKKTRDAIQVMLQKGEAMYCPNCQVIIMKKWGCDWLCCSVCKTEICWVTKGPRWGPKGRGDVSGGCRCGTNGVRCHPNCNYCH